MGNKLIICCSRIEHKNEDDKHIEEYDNNEDTPMKNLINQQQLLYRSGSEHTLIPS